MTGSDIEEANQETLAVVAAFNDAFGKHDVDGIMGLMTEGCIFENTYPSPDGSRYEGQKATRAFWEEFFNSNPKARFETEEIFAAGDRCVVRWADDDDGPGHVLGVDIFRVEGGRVSEKLSYVKG